MIISNKKKRKQTTKVQNPTTDQTPQIGDEIRDANSGEKNTGPTQIDQSRKMQILATKTTKKRTKA